MDDFWNKVLPGSIKTDHGRIKGTDILILVVTLVLFLFTCFRSFRFLQATFTGADDSGLFTIMSIVGLVGLDVAVIVWSLVWIFGSTSTWQDMVAMTMFVVSIIGMVLSSMTDTLSGESGAPEILKITAYYGVPAIILLNVIAAILYHMISPQVVLSRKERRLRASISETKRLGELAQQDGAMKLNLAEEQLKQNEELIRRQETLTRQQLVLDGQRLGINRALADDDTVKASGASVFGRIIDGVRAAIPEHTTPSSPVTAMNSAAPALSGDAQHPTPAGQAKHAGTYVAPDVAEAIAKYKFDDAARQKFEQAFAAIAQYRSAAQADGIDLDDIWRDESHDAEGDQARLDSANALIEQLRQAYDQRKKAQIVGRSVPKA